MKRDYLKKVLSLGLGLAALGSLVFMTAGQAAKGVIKGGGGGGQASFKVEIDGVEVGGFKSVDGIESETEVIEYQDGDDLTIRKRPGRTKYSNIVLKRGFAQNNDLWQWYQEVIKSKNIRKNISVIITKRDGSEAGRYNFFEAWPCKWKGPELSSIGDPDSDLLTEKITFCVERMELK